MLTTLELIGSSKERGTEGSAAWWSTNRTSCRAFWQVSRDRMSPCTNSIAPLARSRLSSPPVARLSSTRTRRACEGEGGLTPRGRGQRRAAPAVVRGGVRGPCRAGRTTVAHSRVVLFDTGDDVERVDPDPRSSGRGVESSGRLDRKGVGTQR